MSKGITLSPKHGVNASMDICFWCGEPKGILMCGMMKGDAEAPKGMVTSLEPCDKCKENFGLGVQIVEVIDDGSRFENNLIFSIKDEDGKVKWPTGRFVVMKADAINGAEAGSVMLCTPETMDKILEKHDKKAKESEGSSDTGEANANEEDAKEEK